MECDRLIIAGHPYEIVNTNDNSECGRSDVDNYTIHINPNFSDKTQIRATIHEAIHCIGKEYGIELTEKNVRRLESALFAFIVNNPMFILEVIRA